MSLRAINWAHSVLPVADLRPTEAAVLLTLAYHHVDKTGECFPSIETLAAHACAGERRTKQAIATLREWNLIKWKRGGTKAGNASNKYTLFGKPKTPKQTGRPVPVSTPFKQAQKSTFETGRPVPVSNVQTSAHERGYQDGEENPAKFGVIAGGKS